MHKCTLHKNETVIEYGTLEVTMVYVEFYDVKEEEAKEIIRYPRSGVKG